jgi:predicted nucleic acid-binding protein
LPVDEVVAREYGRLAAAVVAAGRKPRARMADLLIAATAVAYDATLWTRNPADLVGLSKLIRLQTPPAGSRSEDSNHVNGRARSDHTDSRR